MATGYQAHRVDGQYVFPGDGGYPVDVSSMATQYELSYRSLYKNAVLNPSHRTLHPSALQWFAYAPGLAQMPCIEGMGGSRSGAATSAAAGARILAGEGTSSSSRNHLAHASNLNKFNSQRKNTSFLIDDILNGPNKSVGEEVRGGGLCESGSVLVHSPSSAASCMLGLTGGADERIAYPWLQYTRYKPPKLPRTKRKDGEKKRKLGRNPRVPFSPTQVTVLEQKFRVSQYLSSVDVAQLSSILDLSENRVKIWFQNRRARERREKNNSNPIEQNKGLEPSFIVQSPDIDVVTSQSPSKDAYQVEDGEASVSMKYPDEHSDPHTSGNRPMSMNESAFIWDHHHGDHVP